MSQDLVLELSRQTLFTAATLAAPVLAAAILVGLLLAIFQAVTSIHEQTLTQVPKIACVVVIILLLMPWTLRLILEFCTRVFALLPSMGAR